MKDIAIIFGNSLDQDDFERTADCLSDDCMYQIGEKVLTGPAEICGSYEQNMLDGRQKFDKLEWGKSEITVVDESTFFVHFTDYLEHEGEAYVHKCKQKLFFNSDGKISLIEHIGDSEEQERVDAFYKRVGLK